MGGSAAICAPLHVWLHTARRLHEASLAGFAAVENRCYPRATPRLEGRGVGARASLGRPILTPSLCFMPTLPAGSQSGAVCPLPSLPQSPLVAGSQHV